MEFGPVDIQKVSIEIFSLPSNFYCYFRNYFNLIFTLKVTIEKNTPSRNLFLRIQVPGAQIFRYSNFSLIFLRKIRCFYTKKFLENEFFSIVTYLKEALVFTSSLIPFSACPLYICKNLCRQGCVSTRLDLEGINFHRYNMISGKESYFMNAIPAQKLRKPWKCQYLATEFSLSLRIWKGERD